MPVEFREKRHPCWELEVAYSCSVPWGKHTWLWVMPLCVMSAWRCFECGILFWCSCFLDCIICFPLPRQTELLPAPDNQLSSKQMNRSIWNRRTEGVLGVPVCCMWRVEKEQGNQKTESRSRVDREGDSKGRSGKKNFGKWNKGEVTAPCIAPCCRKRIHLNKLSQTLKTRLC